MKRNLLTIILVMMITTVMAQSRMVNFDYFSSPVDNDLNNNFHYQRVYQTLDSGITGGAVAVPLTGGKMVYKTLLDMPGHTGYVAVDAYFKFKTDSFTSNAYSLTFSLNPVIGGRADSTVGSHFSFRPLGDFFEIAVKESISGVIKVVPVKIINGHWYRIGFLTNTYTNGVLDYVDWEYYLYDYGVDGFTHAIPILTGDRSVVSITRRFTSAPKLALEINASYNCAIKYLDNIKISAPQFLTVPFTSQLVGLTIYPTEVGDELTVDFPGYNNTKDAVFSLTSMLGKRVFSSKLVSMTTKLSVPELPAGIYVACVTTPDGQISKRIVKK